MGHRHRPRAGHGLGEAFAASEKSLVLVLAHTVILPRCGGTLGAQVVRLETTQPHEVPLHCLCLSVQG